MQDLDRYHLRATEWKTAPVRQPKHDFVTPLLESYLNDLKRRQVRDVDDECKLSDVLRKAIPIDYT
jgi:hypothetical protein